MTQEQFGGVVRAVMTALVGYLAGRNVIDSETASALVAAVTTIAIAIWSVRSKKPA